MTTQPGWGGPRQGQPGKGYVNRTDMLTNRAPTGGGGQAQEQAPRRSWVGPDDVPNLTDPSADDRPLTDGLPIGPGAGPSARAPMPDLAQDRTMLMLEMLYEETGSPYLLRLMSRHRGIQVAMGSKR